MSGNPQSGVSGCADALRTEPRLVDRAHAGRVRPKDAEEEIAVRDALAVRHRIARRIRALGAADLAPGDLDGDGAVTNLEVQALCGLLADSAGAGSAPSPGAATKSQAVVTSTVAGANQSVPRPPSEASSTSVIPAAAVDDFLPQLPARLRCAP